MSAKDRLNLRIGLAFISPWILGFLAFSVYPLLSALYFSLRDYSVLSSSVFVGLENYRSLWADAIFWKSIYNTLYFVAFSIPLGLLVSLTLAILLNFDLSGKGIFRTIFFIPSLFPAVCLGVLWQWMLNGELGLINTFLSPVLRVINALTGFHFAAPNWLAEAPYARWGIIFTSLWGVGQAVVIYLAGLQDVPRYLYEAAEIDGAGFWRKTWHITLPAISPVIYFNCIIGLIGAFQVFAIPYVITNGGDGPERSLLFVSTYLFQNAFEYWNMGYACAIGFILFVLVLGVTCLATRFSARHVHYAGN